VTSPTRIERISGRAVAVRGADLDTDRIIPARFLKAVTFDGLGTHLFEDDRRALAERGSRHPLDEPAHQGARILVTGGNFGCGSSREHAPQAIWRWGIRAVIGESFAEIFFGNSLMIGLPCFTAAADDVERLRRQSEAHSALEWTVDVASLTAMAADLRVSLRMPPSAQAALLSGGWDATALLREDTPEFATTVARLPYLTKRDTDFTRSREGE